MGDGIHTQCTRTSVDEVAQLGPPASPVAVIGMSEELRYTSGGGFVPLHPMGTLRVQRLFGASTARFIGLSAESTGRWGFAYTDGYAAWRWQPDLLLPFRVPIYFAPLEDEPWTDGRTVVFALYFNDNAGVPNSDAQAAVLRCDLGP